jgi:hypothetical protein
MPEDRDHELDEHPTNPLGISAQDQVNLCSPAAATRAATIVYSVHTIKMPQERVVAH